MADLLAPLSEQPLAGLMLVVTLGYLLGRLRVRGISVGPAGGTLVVAIGAGAAGLQVAGLYGETPPPVTIGMFGFALFIYSVGFEAGPRFFRSIRGGTGWQFVVVGAAINVLAVGVAIVLGRALGLGGSTTAGLLAGALTSAPTYAAAAEVADQPAHLAVSFALAYPIGLVGLVLVIQLVPRLARDPIAGADGRREDGERRAMRAQHGSPELTRAFEVARAELGGKSLRDLDLTHRTGCVVTRVRRGDWFEVPTAATCLAPGDHLLVTGRVDELHRFEEVVGPEVYDAHLGHHLPDRRIVVTGPDVVGKSLAELQLIRRHQVVVAGIERSDTLIEPTADAVLERDDVVVATGTLDRLEAAAAELGRFEPSAVHTDIAIYAGGIFLGLIVGNLHLRPLGLDVSLGLAGGLLLVGLALGRFRRVGPLSAHVPPPARQLVRDLGILLFVGETGLEAGYQLATGAVSIALGGAVVVTVLSMLVPVALMLLAARALFRMSPADAWGSVSGGMTSSAALVMVKRAAGTNEPAASYAAAYAVASVLVTIAGQIVVLLV